MGNVRNLHVITELGGCATQKCDAKHMKYTSMIMTEPRKNTVHECEINNSCGKTVELRLGWMVSSTQHGSKYLSRRACLFPSVEKHKQKEERKGNNQKSGPRKKETNKTSPTNPNANIHACGLAEPQAPGHSCETFF